MESIRSPGGGSAGASPSRIAEIRSNAHHRRRAFSLVELFVVLAIIVLILTFMLPAIQRARSAARRVNCQNNLKQLGLALHNYWETHTVLPPGYLYRPDSSMAPTSNGAGFGWGAMILPYMEQGSLYFGFDWNVPIHHPANLRVCATSVTAFLCPDDRAAAGTFIEMGPLPERYARATYVACFGVPDLDENPEQRLGLFSRNSCTRFTEATDGLSHTLMVGERRNTRSLADVRVGHHRDPESTWCGAVRDWHEPDDDHGHMVLFHAAHVPNDPRGDERDITAPHAGYANFLLGDGSVRIISENVDLVLYQSLSTHCGNEIIGEY